MTGITKEIIKRKIMRRAAADQTRAAKDQICVFQKLFRNQLLSKNKRKRNRK